MRFSSILAGLAICASAVHLSAEVSLRPFVPLLGTWSIETTLADQAGHTEILRGTVECSFILDDLHFQIVKKLRSQDGRTKTSISIISASVDLRTLRSHTVTSGEHFPFIEECEVGPEGSIMLRVVDLDMNGHEAVQVIRFVSQKQVGIETRLSKEGTIVHSSTSVMRKKG